MILDVAVTQFVTPQEK